MTREKVKELLPILEAYANGKTIQFYRTYPEPHWEDVKPYEHVEFSEDTAMYRIKPEPKYRPFKNAEECFEEMQKHQPFGWVKNEEMKFNILCIRPNGTIRTVINNGIYNSWYSFKDSFRLKFIDGTPFGIKE